MALRLIDWCIVTKLRWKIMTSYSDGQVYPEDECTMVVRNVCCYLLDDKAQLPSYLWIFKKRTNNIYIYVYIHTN